MIGPPLFHCIHSTGKMITMRNNTLRSISKFISISKNTSPIQTSSFSTNSPSLALSKVPPDVLKTKVYEQYCGVKSTVFHSEQTQEILKRMTSVDLSHVFPIRKEATLENPRYKLLTDEELDEEEVKIRQEAERYLEMPEVWTMRKPIDVALTQDDELIDNDLDGSDYIFTDISPSKNFRSRAILVRENDTGVLREANWDERDRMQFLYWPEEGQTYETLRMATDDGLPYALHEVRHEFILDYISLQCQPDSPDYHRVTKRVYKDIAERGVYNLLKSSRHYGGMIFYYVSNRLTDGIFEFFLQNGQTGDAADLVRLISIVHSVKYNLDSSDKVLIREYVDENESLHHLLEILREGVHGEISQ